MNAHYNYIILKVDSQLAFWLVIYKYYLYSVGYIIIIMCIILYALTSFIQAKHVYYRH